MAQFAVIEGENVINTIIAESKEIAEELTGKTCIEFTTEPAGVGNTYVGGVFLPKKPFPSWVLNGKNEWESPVPRPQDSNAAWDESTTSWVEL